MNSPTNHSLGSRFAGGPCAGTTVSTSSDCTWVRTSIQLAVSASPA